MNNRDPLDKKNELVQVRKKLELGDTGAEEFNEQLMKARQLVRDMLGEGAPAYSELKQIRSSAVGIRVGSHHEHEVAPAVRQSTISILDHVIEQVSIMGDHGIGREVGAIFVIHGHDRARKSEVTRLIERATNCNPIVLDVMASGGKTIIEKFEHHAGECVFAVALFTADDVGAPRIEGFASHDVNNLRPRARQNVLFEAGFFFGRLGRGKVALLHENDVEMPSDLHGVVYIAFDETGAWKTHLAREMEAAGVEIDWRSLASL